MRCLTQHRTPSRNPYRTQNLVRATSCRFESHLRRSTKVGDRLSLWSLPRIIGNSPHRADGNRIPPHRTVSRQRGQGPGLSIRQTSVCRTRFSRLLPSLQRPSDSINIPVGRYLPFESKFFNFREVIEVATRFPRILYTGSPEFPRRTRIGSPSLITRTLCRVSQIYICETRIYVSRV